MIRFFIFTAVFLAGTAFGQTTAQTARWTAADDIDGSINHVIQVADSKTGLKLTANDFLLIEDRNLANNHFAMYAEVAGGLPVEGMSIRIWTELGSTKLVQAEAFLQSTKKIQDFMNRGGFTIEGLDAGFGPDQAMSLVTAILKKSDDPKIHSLKVSEVWLDGVPVRIYKIKGARGQHTITVSITQQKVIAHTYTEFPQADQDSGEFNIPVQIYPIYEEVEESGHLLARIPAELKYVKAQTPRVTTNPYAALLNQHYYESKLDPILGNTDAGRAQGYWSMTYLKEQAAKIRAGLPLSDNTFAAPGGVILEGRYATINLHPDAAVKFKGINFTPALSAQFIPEWQEEGVNPEMIPRSTLLGKPLASSQDALNRPARRLPDHDPVSYINDGFDDLQVYYAINTLVESLHDMGFTDPELSTRPFNAFLYNPDISMKDNAFYTDDTINFTTYSSNHPNLARDNSTIWHELGHGIMDRLMGDEIHLADTGGLSEGMADFVAALVIADVTNGVPFDGSGDFRIINNTGFYLTNEVHDDGEAYGGSMKDLLDAAVQASGHQGVVKVADLTMETMRLTRNHPALTAPEWFNHMLFADSLGHAGVRAPGELKSFILKALAGRNFDLAGNATASYTLKNGTQEITATGLGSRNNPLRLSLAADGKAAFHMTAQLKNGQNYKFNFPVQLRVYFTKGAIQGAIHWDGKNNEPITYTVNSEDDVAHFDLAAAGKCDSINRDDGSCVDYAYVQIWNQGGQKPVAKKRFYLRIKTR